MKLLFKIQAMMIVALAVCWGCSDDKTAVEAPAVAPQVKFTAAETEMSAYVHDAVRFEAVVESSGPLDCCWYVEGKLVASTASMTYVFPAVGIYDVCFEASNTAGRVEKSYSVTVVGTPLEIGFSPETDAITCHPGDEVIILAKVIGDDQNVSHQWKVGDDVVSTDAEFKYMFATVGSYTVTYLGVNAYDISVNRQWTVNVDELPLDILFSVAEANISCVQGRAMEIVATVVNGGIGLTHEWKVGNDVVSTTAALSHTFDAAGDYTITYSGVNGKSETVSRTWAVQVTAAGEISGYMFEDFEARPELPGHFVNGNAAIEGITLQDNPYQTAINPSNKVLRDLLQTESATSGFFDMGFGHLNNRENYRAIRVKIYVGKNLYYPRMQLTTNSVTANKQPSMINGQLYTDKTENGWKALIKTDDWNVFVYDLIDCGYGAANFGNISTVQFRPLSKFDGSSCSGRDAETNTRTVYYDDFEFLE